ncbi:putative Anp1-domain-containing protein [Seiridium unicorne]|uniref:Anp1-domain-containing protein n=1 Tax=Seiridium unicorne TaxID=138068 RepID=A0ABR2VG63_9PEZI
MRLAQNRYVAAAAVVLIILFLSYTTEPRRRSYSCKTLKSCVWSAQHRYAHPPPADPVVVYRSKTLNDGTQSFEREMLGSNPEILILVLNKDKSSWSQDFRSTGRNVYDFLDLLVSTGLDFNTVSIGLMTSSWDEFQEMKEATSTLPFARAAIFHQEDHGPHFSYQERHSPAVQQQRRVSIAALRNYLMLRTIRDEEHVFWMDADVVEYSGGIIQTMLNQSETREDVGLLTARCQQHLIESYDKNAWVMDREKTDLLGPVSDDARPAALGELVESRRYVDELIRGTNDSVLVPLDSVGGTLLYIRARLVRQGLVFPTYNVVGTTWSREGWIGVETEGICYVASQMQGGGCFVLGGRHQARHADWG